MGVTSSVDGYMLHAEHWNSKIRIETQIEFHVKCKGFNRILTIVIDGSVFLMEKRFDDFDRLVDYILRKKRDFIS